MPAVAGMGPLTAGPSAALTVLVCRSARTTAWEHACMPTTAGMEFPCCRPPFLVRIVSSCHRVNTTA
jgi:hypothetical protein